MLAGTLNVAAEASRLKDTDRVVVPPALVALHVAVMATPSVAMVVVAHPVVLVIPVSGSVTSHDTVTSLVYQLLAPSVPTRTEATTGGVVSLTVTVNLPALVFPALSVAVQVTSVWPIGNRPATGAQETAATPLVKSAAEGAAFI